jgi:hypothetical protein
MEYKKRRTSRSKYGTLSNERIREGGILGILHMLERHK